MAESRSKCHPVDTAMRMSKSVISRLKKSTKCGNATQKHAGGHGRIATPQEDRYISLETKRNRNVMLSQIAADLAIATSTHVFLPEPLNAE